MKLLFTVLLAPALVVLGDITFSRTVSQVRSGASGNLTFDSGCSSHDEFGDNDCDFAYNSTHVLNVDIQVPAPLYGNASLNVDLTIDLIDPFSFTCPVCGAACSFTIPIVGKQVSFNMPACPIARLSQQSSFKLPSSNPAKVPTGIKGYAEVKDADGSVVAHVDIQAKLE